jgi:hypothetical protein
MDGYLNWTASDRFPLIMVRSIFIYNKTRFAINCFAGPWGEQEEWTEKFRRVISERLGMATGGGG